MFPLQKIFPPARVVTSRRLLQVGIFFGLLFIGGCTRADRPAAVDDDWDDGIRPVSESWDVRYTVTESGSDEGSGRPRLHMDAGYMASFESDSSFTLLRAADDQQDQPVHAVIFDVETGDTSAVVTAQRIIYREDQRRFDAEGDVAVDGRQNRWMWSEQIFWNERTQRLRAPGFVRIITPTERIEGYNLDADEDLNNFVLERVTGEIEIENEEEDVAP